MGVTIGERLSDVDGFSIVLRPQHRPRVHLLRPYAQCNVPDSAVRVEGSREQLDAKLHELGYRRGAVSCGLCFPYYAADDVLEPELAYAEEETDQ